MEVFVKKIEVRSKSFFIACTVTARILDKEKVSQNAALFFVIKGHCNNLEELIGSTKNRLFLSHEDDIVESFEHTFHTKICSTEDDEIILEIRIDLENV